jgi:hypothetical protein
MRFAVCRNSICARTHGACRYESMALGPIVTLRGVPWIVDPQRAAGLDREASSVLLIVGRSRFGEPDPGRRLVVWSRGRFAALTRHDARIQALGVAAGSFSEHAGRWATSCQLLGLERRAPMQAAAPSASGTSPCWRTVVEQVLFLQFCAEESTQNHGKYGLVSVLATLASSLPVTAADGYPHAQWRDHILGKEVAGRERIHVQADELAPHGFLGVTAARRRWRQPLVLQDSPHR